MDTKGEENLNKQEYIEMLKKGIATVTFKKEDGSTREMRATLLNEYIPDKEPLHGGAIKTTVKDSVVHRQGEILSSNDLNPNVVKAWDVEAKGWRSFRVDRVDSFLTE